MKSKLSILIVMCMLLGSFCGCSVNDDTAIVFEETTQTGQADAFFEQKDATELKKLCAQIALNTTNAEDKDNFFNYLITKIDYIIENGEEDKYVMTLDLLDSCIKLPLTDASLVSALRNQYHNIDTLLIEKSKEYILGEWKMLGTLTNQDYMIDVKNGENGIEAFITSVTDISKFDVGDVKWTNIHFANYKEFYLSVLTSEKNLGFESEYADNKSFVYVYSGAKGSIDFENEKIVVSYEKSDINDGSNTVWARPDAEPTPEETPYAQ